MSKETNHIRTYRELSEQVKTLLDRQGFPSRDNRFPLHLIYDVLLDNRTSFIKRQDIARQGIGQQNVQTISCVKLVKADMNICPCRPPAGCTWQRSSKPVPKTIFLNSVTNSNAGFKADYVEWSQFKNKLHSRSSSPNSRYYTFLDTGEGSYIYLYNDIFLENISLTGLWENPNHAAYFTSCKKETKRQEYLRCNPLDTPLYMDREVTDIVMKTTFQFLSQSTLASTPDVKNDFIDDSTGLLNNTV